MQPKNSKERFMVKKKTCKNAHYMLTRASTVGVAVSFD
jgi:hypothetical protein